VRAAVYTRYGPSEVVQLTDVAKLPAGARELLGGVRGGRRLLTRFVGTRRVMTSIPRPEQRDIRS
jgi:hypothetical protein